MSKYKTQLPKIESSTDLLAFLRDDLNWPLPDDAILEDISFDWSGDDLRLHSSAAEKLKGGTVRQLRPVVPGQPWGIFLIEFNDLRVYQTALRQVLRGLVPNRRRHAALPAWQHENILFICATRDYASLSFAHFKDDSAQRSRLATFGWSRGSTYLRTLLEHNIPRLAWPTDEGTNPSEWLAQWASAFDKEPVTNQFFADFNSVFSKLTAEISKRHPRWNDEEVERQSQTLLNRLLFLYFVQRKGWLNRERDYLVRNFRDHYKKDPRGSSYIEEFLRPLFVKLSTRDSHADISDHDLPFLNGGLFADEYGAEQRDEEVRKHYQITVGNDVFQQIFDDLLEAYNFTVREDTPLDIDVAIDPEMLGKIFESLVLQLERSGSGGKNSRHDTGSYYTPRPIVHYLCCDALKAWLAQREPFIQLSDQERGESLDTLFNLDTSAGLSEAGLAKLETLLTPEQARILANSLSELRACDPAVGSGAFPVVLLHELINLSRLCETRARGKDPVSTDSAWLFDTKTRFIERAIYGVDLQRRAIEICKLRLWLSLVVDHPLEVDVNSCERRSFVSALRKLPSLPNLEFKIRAANALADHIHGQRFLLQNLAAEDRARLPLNRLIAAKRDYFNASSVPEKRRLRLVIYEALTELGELELARARNEYGLMPSDEDAVRADELERARKQLTSIRGQIQAARRMKAVQQDDALERIRSFFDDEDKPTFVWQLDFAEVFHREKNPRFDLIIGNPPYVRTQVISQNDPEFAAWLKVNYISASKGNYDLYVVFVERSLQLLQDRGQLALILPHKFFNAQYGEPLRKILAEGKHLRHVVHFGDQQIFPGAINYVCLLFLSRPAVENCRWQVAHDLKAWLETRTADQGVLDAGKVTQAEWNFVVGKGADLFQSLAEAHCKLKDIADRIFQGLITGADAVFILKKTGKNTFRSEATGEDHELETRLVHPLCKGAVDIRRYYVEDVTRFILFPYLVKGDSAGLIPEEQFRNEFPRIWKYLLQNRAALEQRERGKWRHERWYAFGRSQALTEMEQPKILTPSIAAAASFTVDQRGEFYFIGSGGGGGGGYGITLRAESQLSLVFVAGILNSRVADFYLKHVSSRFAGGYFAYSRQFLEGLPIPALDLTKDVDRHRHDSIARLVEWLLWLYQQPLVRHLGSDAPRDPLIAAYFEQWLNALVYELFFPAELRRSDLCFFDIFPDLKLPVLHGPDENGAMKMETVRQFFEKVSASGNPLRVALERLQTLDLVRTIQKRK